jgi:hypothetical protein
MLDCLRRDYQKLMEGRGHAGSFYFREKVDLGYEKAQVKSMEPVEDKDWLNDAETQRRNLSNNMRAFKFNAGEHQKIFRRYDP